MRNLGAQEAADAIRGKFFSDRSMRGDPADAHRMKFAKEVAKLLGGDESPETVQHVMMLLREEGIELHAGHEFPKYATRKHDRVAKIVHSEGEEQAWIDEPPPEPVDPDQLPPLRTMDAPVQDLSLDLRNSVPGEQNRQGDMHVPKVPSAVTNREAAQDAYARQPADGSNRDAAAAAYDEANPGLDHTHVHTEDNTGDAFHDDGVHVEDVNLNTLTGNAEHDRGGATYAKPASTGVTAHDDPDRDGIAGQDKDPTHDSVLGTNDPKNRSGDSSAGKTDQGRRPVGQRQPTTNRPK